MTRIFSLLFFFTFSFLLLFSPSIIVTVTEEDTVNTLFLMNVSSPTTTRNKKKEKKNRSPKTTRLRKISRSTRSTCTRLCVRFLALAPGFATRMPPCCWRNCLRVRMKGGPRITKSVRLGEVLSGEGGRREENQLVRQSGGRS